jgi:hypothetical protein
MNSRWLTDENAHNICNISASFIIWTTIYLTIYSRKTSNRIIEIAPNFLRLKRQELAIKITSILHAAYTAHGAYIGILDFENQNFDFFKRSELVTYYANVAAGFFIADLILCIILIEEHGIQFVIHAIVSLCGSIYVSMTGIGHQYFIHLLLFEASTPFLHIRYLLIEYGYGKSIISVVNNLFFLLTFGYFRLYKGVPILTKMCYMLLIENPISIPVTLFFIIASLSMTYLERCGF